MRMLPKQEGISEKEYYDVEILTGGASHALAMKIIFKHVRQLLEETLNFLYA